MTNLREKLARALARHCGHTGEDDWDMYAGHADAVLSTLTAEGMVIVGWQPVETASKDMADVLLASNAGHVTVGRWSDALDGWDTKIGTFHIGTKVKGAPCRITHWMPLPDAPALEGNRE
jgi:hypothetical protein